MTRVVVRAVVSVGLLALVAVVVDVGEVMRRLTRLHAGWVLTGLAISVAQVVLSAWRWRYTAGRLDVGLPWGAAIREYYLATFLNQVLPGGVLGDVSRAWRQRGSASDPVAGTGAQTPDRALRAVHAVILERVSGQLVMTSVAVASAFALLFVYGGGDRVEAPIPEAAGAGPFLVGALVLLVVGLLGFGFHRVRGLAAWARLKADAVRALLGPALPVQASLSLVIVASYVAVFLVAAQAVGATASAPVLALLVPPILVTMLLPVSISGWGVREGAAAALWGAVGLTPAEGVAVSVVYGLLVLVSSLPGAAVPVFTPLGSARGRRADRSRAGSDGPKDEAPGPGSRPEGA